MASGLSGSVQTDLVSAIKQVSEEAKKAKAEVKDAKTEIKEFEKAGLTSPDAEARLAHGEAGLSAANEQKAKLTERQSEQRFQSAMDRQTKEIAAGIEQKFRMVHGRISMLADLARTGNITGPLGSVVRAAGGVAWDTMLVKYASEIQSKSKAAAAAGASRLGAALTGAFSIAGLTTAFAGAATIVAVQKITAKAEAVRLRNEIAEAEGSYGLAMKSYVETLGGYQSGEGIKRIEEDQEEAKRMASAAVKGHEERTWTKVTHNLFHNMSAESKLLEEQTKERSLSLSKKMHEAGLNPEKYSFKTLSRDPAIARQYQRLYSTEGGFLDYADTLVTYTGALLTNSFREDWLKIIDDQRTKRMAADILSAENEKIMNEKKPTYKTARHERDIKLRALEEQRYNKFGDWNPM